MPALVPLGGFFIVEVLYMSEQELRQPDPEKHLQKVEELQDLAAKIVGELQLLQETSENGTIEFSTTGVTPETCEAAVKSYRELSKNTAKLFYGLGVNQGQAAFFLAPGASEGTVPPCNC